MEFFIYDYLDNHYNNITISNYFYLLIIPINLIFILQIYQLPILELMLNLNLNYQFNFFFFRYFNLNLIFIII